ncbi:MAG: hypothetical protein A2908_01920 [Candidatus Staskawiczbacteria bacterium RIFCSPLOWO2_01_FULL_38_12b]|uniref:Uncharacterized protein n=1 Tax=Candidatus Staskawiczbacteria bacterium RIFCSPLOWO2_01_FULL_38_12b TaxID=1802214 RepID=A0A1G2IEX4_9BACT|nr:MAG: hypothetical protein A2908_01920 [Candidatus Staskawiczbacteria bacterium RIFCSPLOWO2_01_FULL_38_12b]QBM02612.1 hypothetical protein [uncultured archaeon]
MKNKKITIDDLALMMKKGFDGVDRKLDIQDEKISEIKTEIRALDLKFSQKMNELTTTLDRFLKRMTDMEDEFAMMKNDLNRMKKVIREKLGVDLT